MHDTAIELLIIGNPQSETEGYLTALRNSGIAVHAHPLEHDKDAITIACGSPIDLILYTTSLEAMFHMDFSELCSGLPSANDTAEHREAQFQAVANVPFWGELLT